MIKTFALAFGAIYLLVGILGFVPGLNDHNHADMPPLAIDQSYGRLLGLFPVNLVHNAVHILIGIWGLLSAKSVGAARLFGKGLAIIYGLLTVLGLVPGADTLFGLAPIFGLDVWLHALSALVAAYFGFVAGDTDADLARP